MTLIKEDILINKDLVDEFTDKYANIWWSGNSYFASAQKVYSKSEKKNLEKKLDGFIKTIKPKRSFYFGKLSEAKDIEAELISFANTITAEISEAEKELIEKIPVKDFVEATKIFIKKSKEFDSLLTTGDIYQACRNVWIMNIIQQMAGMKVEITPSVFAYSLLYPYCDNYIDDPKITWEKKIEFGLRLKKRLEGEEILPINQHELKVYSLVLMIENQFERELYPQVYQSLLSIHRAQMQSLKLQRAAVGITQDEMLRVNIEKGGTSVLADGCLICGALSPEQMYFIFGMGAYLQFADDMQDIVEDASSGNLSVYAKEAITNKLDEHAYRTLAFGERILQNGNYLNGENEEKYISVLKSGMGLMLLVLSGLFENYYSIEYIRRNECYSPFHFSFIRKNFQKYSKKGNQLLDILAQK